MSFDRRAILQIQGRDLSALRLSFDVSRTLRGTPNKAEIKVFNLNAETRRTISDADEARTILLAGYADEDVHIVFLGGLRRVKHTLANGDWVTTISSGDGRPRSVRLSKAFGAGSNLGQVLNVIGLELESAGVQPGNLFDTARALESVSVGDGGYAISGSADLALDALLERQGLEWSIQDQQIQILERNKARQTRAVLLSTDTTLVGSPEVLEKGRIKARSLIAPGLTPGLLVRVESRDLRGFYRVDSSRTQGDTYAAPWWIDIEARSVG